MTTVKRIAFFAPIKPPDHPIPSGDRLIAQNLIKAIQFAGHKIDLASRYICYSKRSNQEILIERKAGAIEEAARLIDHYQSLPVSSRPELWITYHPYCKAPDWIGPRVSASLDIPYITVEAARTGQGGESDEWALWRAEAQTGIKSADMHLVFKPTDHKYLSLLLGGDSKLRDLRPFMNTDIGLIEAQSLPDHWDPKVPVLVTTGMMRKGKKDKNFYMLADILSGITDKDWHLIVVGGGPEEEQVRTAFSKILSEKIHWTGQVEHREVLGWMKAADIFIWPGWKEPIGMVYLEAQLQGKPVIAYKSMGVPLVVEHEVTGLLAPEGDMAAMRKNIARLLDEPILRQQMGASAQQKAIKKHSIAAAAASIDKALQEF